MCSIWSQDVCIVCFEPLLGAPEQLWLTKVHQTGVGLYCVDLPKAPFVARSHLQLSSLCALLKEDYC